MSGARVSHIKLETSRLLLELTSRAEAVRVLDAAALPGLGFYRTTDARSVFLVWRQDTGAVIGDLTAEPGRVDPTTVWVFYEIAEGDRGAGFAPEALAALSRWLCDQNGASRVRAEVLSGNTASQRVAAKAGFCQTAEANGQIWEFTCAGQPAAAQRG